MKKAVCLLVLKEVPAVIETFDILVVERLNENISAIINQVDKVVVVDNGSENADDIKKILARLSQITLIELDENKGKRPFHSPFL